MPHSPMINYFDYIPGYLQIKDEIEKAIRRVIDSGQLILGPEVRAFEREFAAYTGVHGAVGVGSGTDALVLALQALGISPGDEIITVANGGVPPVAAIRAIGAVPRFVDVDPGTLLMDRTLLETALTDRTRCILPVHLYGQPAPMYPILEFAAAHKLRVVEDCAQAHGSFYDGRHVGGFGDIGCFSFYPTKNLGAFGDGGLCVTDDPALEEHLRMLRFYGFRNDRHAHCDGINSRLDELQAAILRVKLRHLSDAIETRREIARTYRNSLAGSSFRLTGEAKDGTHAYHLFVIRTPDRTQAIDALNRAAIGYGIHYPEPVHLMEAYRHLGGMQGDLPVTEAACDSVISLPIYPGLSLSDARRVADTLLSLALRESLP